MPREPDNGEELYDPSTEVVVCVQTVLATPLSIISTVAWMVRWSAD